MGHAPQIISKWGIPLLLTNVLESYLFLKINPSSFPDLVGLVRPRVDRDVGYKTTFRCVPQGSALVPDSIYHDILSNPVFQIWNVDFAPMKQVFGFMG